ncbi:YbaB/EbfC family nucleoid-associated protein [Lentzea kentuckyensis]|uniref:YbaB/EbfC family nucleoid-associated protein n=1 Tax=Lentzea kentuckyensis TaxID=360086 RepID=UPI000A3D3CD4|nr:YbaB/EbfC family nucleoid-associated protein [Lentzea kentuckyensis]
MSDPMAHVERMVDDWERDADRKAARYQEMAREAGQISITAAAADGAVTVTVGANGIPTHVAMTDAVRRLPPDRIAAAVLEAMRGAQAQFPGRLAEIMAQTVGEDSTTRYLLDQARTTFPPPADETSRGASPARRLPDDDLGDESYLRPGR